MLSVEGAHKLITLRIGATFARSFNVRAERGEGIRQRNGRLPQGIRGFELVEPMLLTWVYGITIIQKRIAPCPPLLLWFTKSDGDARERDRLQRRHCPWPFSR